MVQNANEIQGIRQNEGKVVAILDSMAKPSEAYDSPQKMWMLRSQL